MKRLLSMLLVVALIFCNTPFISYAEGETVAYTLTDTGREGGFFTKLSVRENESGSSYVAYCFDPQVDYNPAYPDYELGTLDASLQQALRAVLRKTYPVLTTAQIDALWGTSGITASEAYDATQCAIWYIISNGSHETPSDLFSDNGNILYTGLIGGSVTIPESLALSIDASEAVSTDIDFRNYKHGPFRLYANSGIDALDATINIRYTPAVGDNPYTIIDASGSAVTVLNDNTDYWIKSEKKYVSSVNPSFYVDNYYTIGSLLMLESVIGSDFAQSVGYVTPVAQNTPVTLAASMGTEQSLVKISLSISMFNSGTTESLDHSAWAPSSTGSATTSWQLTPNAVLNNYYHNVGLPVIVLKYNEGEWEIVASKRISHNPIQSGAHVDARHLVYTGEPGRYKVVELLPHGTFDRNLPHDRLNRSSFSVDYSIISNYDDSALTGTITDAGKGLPAELLDYRELADEQDIADFWEALPSDNAVFRALEFNLVTGDDVTVRARNNWLKTDVADNVYFVKQYEVNYSLVSDVPFTFDLYKNAGSSSINITGTEQLDITIRSGGDDYYSIANTSGSTQYYFLVEKWPQGVSDDGSTSTTKSTVQNNYSKFYCPVDSYIPESNNGWTVFKPTTGEYYTGWIMPVYKDKEITDTRTLRNTMTTTTGFRLTKSLSIDSFALTYIDYIKSFTEFHYTVYKKSGETWTDPRQFTITKSDSNSYFGSIDLIDEFPGYFINGEKYMIIETNWELQRQSSISPTLVTYEETASYVHNLAGKAGKNITTGFVTDSASPQTFNSDRTSLSPNHSGVFAAVHFEYSDAVAYNEINWRNQIVKVNKPSSYERKIYVYKNYYRDGSLRQGDSFTLSTTIDGVNGTVPLVSDAASKVVFSDTNSVNQWGSFTRSWGDELGVLTDLWDLSQTLEVKYLSAAGKWVDTPQAGVNITRTRAIARTATINVYDYDYQLFDWETSEVLKDGKRYAQFAFELRGDNTSVSVGFESRETTQSTSFEFGGCIFIRKSHAVDPNKTSIGGGVYEIRDAVSNTLIKNVTLGVSSSIAPSSTLELSSPYNAYHIIYGLPPGTYKVIEKTPPTNYVLNGGDADIRTVTVAASQTIETTPRIDFTNYRNCAGQVWIRKQSGVNPATASLTGGVYRISKYNGATYEFLQDQAVNASLVNTSTYHSSFAGYYIIGGLTAGDYMIEEITPPNGFLLNPVAADNIKFFTVEAQQSTQNVPKVVFTNYRPSDAPWLGKITVTKRNQASAALENGVFNIYKSADVAANGNSIDGVTPVQTLDMADTSSMTSDYLITDTPYEIWEMTAPTGIATLAEPVKVHTFTLTSASKLQSVVIVNNQFSSFSIFKHDRKHSNVSLPGAELEISILNVTTGLYDYLTTITTTNTKHTFSNMPYGTYRIVEKQAPAGFINQDREYTLIVDSDTAKTLHIFNDNEPIQYGRIEIQKKGTNEAPAPDGTYDEPPVTYNVGPATFELYDSDDRQLDTFVTDSSGYYLSSLLPVGSYYLVETSAPAGYAKVGGNINVSVTNNNTTRIEPLNYRVSTSAIIQGSKSIGSIPSTTSVFGFTLTQVADAIKTPMASPFTATASSSGGSFSFTVPNLMAGTYYYVVSETAGSDGWIYDNSSFVVEIVVTNGSPLQATVNYLDGAIIFANSLATTSLVVSKDFTVPARSRPVDFTLTCDGSPVDLTSNGITVTVTDGEGAYYPVNLSAGRFSLTHDTEITITGLQSRKTYTVTEDVPSGFYSPTVTGGTPATNGASVYLDETNQTGSIAFLNAHIPLPGSIELVKNVAGPFADTSKQFEFTVTFSDATGVRIDGEPFVNGSTVTLAHGESASFANISPNTSYTIVESDYSADRYTSNRPNNEATGTLDDTGTGVMVVFTNTYAALPGSLELEKTVDGDEADEEKLFDFQVTLSDATGATCGGEPFVNGSTISLKHGETVLIEGIPAGATYTIVEANYSADNYTSDKPNNTATGVVREDTCEMVRFVNTYAELSGGTPVIIPPPTTEPPVTEPTPQTPETTVPPVEETVEIPTEGGGSVQPPSTSPDAPSEEVPQETEASDDLPPADTETTEIPDSQDDGLPSGDEDLPDDDTELTYIPKTGVYEPLQIWIFFGVLSLSSFTFSIKKIRKSEELSQ